MTDNTNIAPERGEQSKAPNPAPAGRIVNRRLAAQIRLAIETGGGVDDILPLVQQLRNDANSTACSDLDRFLVERVSSLLTHTKELANVHGELRQRLEQLLAPPYYPARYLGPIMTNVGEYARVLHGGALRVIAFSDAVTPAELGVGDEVLLSCERNLIVEAAASSAESGDTAALVRQIDEARLLIADRDAEVVVTIGDALAADELKPGDTIVWDRAARIAIGSLEADASLGYEDIDDTPPQELGGFDQDRDEVLSNFVLTIANPELASDYGVMDERSHRILLCGPSGTGKTTFMKTIASGIARATQRNCRVVTVSGAELFSSYVGETERKIRRCFAILDGYDGPGIIFFDEIDAIGRQRGHSSGYHDDRFLSTLLAEMEGMRRTNVAVIATTNRVDVLDPALRSRFATEIEMPRPDMASARQIFAIHLAEDIPYRPNSGEAPQTRQTLIDAGVSRLYDPNADNMIASLQFRDGKRRDVAARELVSGRLIEQICVAARSRAFGRHCQRGESGVSLADMQTAAGDAIARLRKTLNRQNVASYLPDLPQDVGVVAVEAYRPRVSPERYLQQPGESS